LYFLHAKRWGGKKKKKRLEEPRLQIHKQNQQFLDVPTRVYIPFFFFFLVEMGGLRGVADSNEARNNTFPMGNIGSVTRDQVFIDAFSVSPMGKVNEGANQIREVSYYWLASMSGAETKPSSIPYSELNSKHPFRMGNFGSGSLILDWVRYLKHV